MKKKPKVIDKVDAMIKIVTEEKKHQKDEMKEYGKRALGKDKKKC